MWKFVNPAVPISPKAEEGGTAKDRAKKRGPKYNNIVFRVYRYGFDCPAFKGKDLTPGLTLSEYIEDNPPVVPLELPEEMKRKK